MKYKQLTAMIVLALSVSKSWAFCSDTVEPTVNPDKFILDAELGIITDSDTGLMWSVCNLGETWSQATESCEGSAKSYNWQTALQQANAQTIAGYSDWRLPNVKELMSIIERQCAEPAINLDLFPSTKSEPYWTATPVYNALSDNQVWAVQFTEGSNHQSLKSRVALSRLVRKVTQ